MGSDNNSPIVNTSDTDIGSNMDAKSTLKLLRSRNLNRLIIGYLNINSIRSKLKPLSEINSQNIDILMITEIALDASFPNQQFSLEGYSLPIRLDRNQNGGGLLIYIQHGIAAHQFMSFKHTDDFEFLTLEVTISKQNGYYLAFIALRCSPFKLSWITWVSLLPTIAPNMITLCCLTILMLKKRKTKLMNLWILTT